MPSAAKSKPALPDWWERERQRRMRYVLAFLVSVLLLIAYFYYTEQNTTGVAPIPDSTAGLIVFVRQTKGGDTTLYTVKADGADLQPRSRPDDKSTKSEPTWTRDGKQIIYAAMPTSPRVSQIFALGQGESKQLTYGAGNKFAPMASPDGKHIAFITQGAIKSVLLNGQDFYQIMPPPQAGNSESGEGAGPADANDAAQQIQGAFQTAAFSFDGAGIAGVKEIGGEENPTTIGDVYLGDQAAFALPVGAEKSILLDSAKQVSVAWDPKASRLLSAFVEARISSGPQANSLFSGIILWDFSNPRAAQHKSILVSKGTSFEPANIAWSPDGSMLAFELWTAKSEDKRDLAGIAVMPFSESPDPHNVKIIVATGAAGRPGKPRWSPDSQTLLFEVTRPDGGRDLWVIRPDGTAALNLTRGDGVNFDGAWSPATTAR